MADKEKSVYDLDLHESVVIKNTLGGVMEVTRVPGGWLYAMEFPGFRQSPVTFVPFDNDFMGVISKSKNIKYEIKQDPEEGNGHENAE